jgi:DNA polymerase-3 subunit delta'
MPGCSPVPKGIGKATLAWRIARFLWPRRSMTSDALFGAPPYRPRASTSRPSTPWRGASRQLSEPGSVPRSAARERHEKAARDVIAVDDVRALKRFFGLSARGNGQRRVVIVDCADEMNPNAANALLKMLEEPPRERHASAGDAPALALLPTIRSRCRSCAFARSDRRIWAAPCWNRRRRDAWATRRTASALAANCPADRSGEAVRLLIGSGGPDDLCRSHGLVWHAAGAWTASARLKLARKRRRARGRRPRFDLTLDLTGYRRLRGWRGPGHRANPRSSIAARRRPDLLTRLAPDAGAGGPGLTWPRT